MLIKYIIGKSLWISPRDIVYKFKGDPWPNSNDWVIMYHWPTSIQYLPITKTQKYQACLKHWREFCSWEETGIYDYMLKTLEYYISVSRNGESRINVDGCCNISDIKLRYQYLDKVYNLVKKEKSFRTKPSPDTQFPLQHKKNSDIIVHIGPDGYLYHGHDGNHRIAIATILDIPIKVTVGCVHVSASPQLRHILLQSCIYSVKDKIQLIINILCRWNNKLKPNV